MKRVTGLVLLLFLAAGIAPAQNKTRCSDWRISAVTQTGLPFFADRQSVDGKTYDLAALLENIQPDGTGAVSWQVITPGSDSLIATVTGENQLIQMAGFIRSDRWTKASLTITTNAVFEVWLDGKRVKSQARISDKPVKSDLTLGTGVHTLLLKLISTGPSLKFAADLAAENESAQLAWSIDPKRTLTIGDILDGVSLADARLSPSGKYLIIQTGEVLTGSGKSQRSTTIYDVELNRNLLMLPNTALRADWMPQSDRLVFQVDKDGRSDVIIYDMKSGKESVAATGLKSPGRIVWSPNEDYFVYSRSEEAQKTGDLKRVFGNEDRVPGTRGRSHLWLYDLNSRVARPLTSGSRSASLQAISPDGTRLLFSTSWSDYSEVPFTRQNLYELELATMKLDTIWKDKLYGGSCQYSPDGKQLLVSGGPETFGEVGVKVSPGRIPNSYDTQLFLYDLKSGKVESLTRDFDPAAGRPYWAPDGRIWLTADEKDYVNLYRYDLKKRSFTKMTVPEDVISSVSYAARKPVAAVRGSSISSPEKLYLLDLNSGKISLLLDPSSPQLKDVEFGRTEEWNFTNSQGTTIYGRVYYPVGYDPAKKYPVIVNYYGGTTPTNRAFGGRYPKNVWTAEGYMVYVLQPSGATGFGQDFSALHVNGWGREAIEDIIEGTKKFLEAHPAADAANVGCIGASYGGYTTMMLQTRTDIFRTAISHAGISDISSYWGEGYWGYSYSAGATKNSYPWNRRDIYVDNSPLFRADKFNNSILLLHGTDDTNVPVGESLQFYAALKILGKNVEMVLVSGENHHILDYKKRIEWHNTIMSWFDKELKSQPQHWNELYPDKNL